VSICGRTAPNLQAAHWTRDFHEHGLEGEATTGGERVRAKGDLSRRRTIIQDEPPPRQAENWTDAGR